MCADDACSGWTITSYCCSVIGGSEAIRRWRLYWLGTMLSNHLATTFSSFNSLPWVSHVNALLIVSTVKGGSTGTAGEGGSHGELRIGQHWRRGFEAPKTGGGVARGAARAELIDWSSHTTLACQHPVSIYVTVSACYRGGMHVSIVDLSAHKMPCQQSQSVSASYISHHPRQTTVARDGV